MSDWRTSDHVTRIESTLMLWNQFLPPHKAHLNLIVISFCRWPFLQNYFHETNSSWLSSLLLLPSLKGDVTENIPSVSMVLFSISFAGNNYFLRIVNFPVFDTISSESRSCELYVFSWELLSFRRWRNRTQWSLWLFSWFLVEAILYCQSERRDWIMK